MKVGTDLYLIRPKKVVQPMQYISPSANTMSWESHFSISEEHLAVKRGMRAAAQRWPKSRIARVEELRAQVESGTYRVDSMILAEKMLTNEGHFFKDEEP